MMIFQDFTVIGGAIQSQRFENTNELVPEAIHLCKKLLKRLRKGEEFVTHGVEGLPEFGVGLGAPQWLIDAAGESVEAPGRFFRIGYGGLPEYLVNLVLPMGAQSERDRRACATLLGLSYAGTHLHQRSRIDSTDEMVERFMVARPLLAAAIVPVPMLDMNIVKMAADFSTCFAAAMLLEEN